jgi:hypothetical protein
MDCLFSWRIMETKDSDQRPERTSVDSSHGSLRSSLKEGDSLKSALFATSRLKALPEIF